MLDLLFAGNSRKRILELLTIKQASDIILRGEARDEFVPVFTGSFFNVICNADI